MYITRLPYQADGATVFAPFAPQPYSVFIDSCGRDRFDIIAANPSQVIVTQEPEEDPFRLAKELLKRESIDYEADQIPEELPFTIGAIGYFSYDLGYPLQQLTPTAKADVGLPSAVIGFYDWSLIIDHKERMTYLISRNPRDPVLPQPSAGGHYFTLTSKFLPNLSKTQYAAAFEKIKHHLHAGDCYQINLAQRFSAQYHGSPWAAYQQLRRQNPMPMAAYMNLPEGAILCLSPERFLQVNRGQVITQPIKGTSPRFPHHPNQDQQSAQALLASTKDRAENLMIVDLLRNDLGKCCRPGSIRAPKLCALESFTRVHHLVSTVTGQLEADQHPLDLLRSCFPGGSITGAPKRRAMEIIDQLEPHQRSVYCGSIAFCDIRGRMDSNIAIRTLLCNRRQIHCYGGGGIVNDSTMESEYHEIQTKISHLLNILERESVNIR